jgi:hypothetical protein
VLFWRKGLKMPKGLVRSRKEKKDIKHNGQQKKKTKGQTIQNITKKFKK